ncbi:MAG TPA: DUF1109 domain-containing protein [Terriglobia bacterium]|nr:DUF1109 domain-containing protein [Terriglobia bacterium]
MKDTERLIRGLAENIRPVHRLPHPWVRTGVWLAVSLLYTTAVLIVMVLRRGAPVLQVDTRFLIEAASAFAVGVIAAASAFALTIPGYGRKLLLVLVFPLGIWLGSLFDGCVQDWMRRRTLSLSLHHDMSCLPFIVFLGLVPAIVMAVMLRRGAPLNPHLTVALGALAAAGMGNLGLRLIYPENADLGLLVWHVGGIFVLSALAALAGRTILNWQSITGVFQNGGK